MDFRYRLMRFMSGRNGPDELFALIFAVSVILSVINIFVRSYILQIAVYAFGAFPPFLPKYRAQKARK